MKKVILAFGSVLLALTLLAVLFKYFSDISPKIETPDQSVKVIELEFPIDRYPETANHIQEAIDSGHSNICTIDRVGADENRDKSLKGIPTKKGYDRDEWPMAMCSEGGAGASIEYIDPSDNRGAGSWVGNQLEDYPDGTQVHFIFP